MLRADFPGRLNWARKNWESPRMGGLLSRIKLGCSSGESCLCRRCCENVPHMQPHCARVSCPFVRQFHDLLSQTTSPLSQLDPYTSRSMDMLLPLAESDRRRRALEQDCSISLRSFSERPRSVVSLSSFLHFDHCGRPPNTLSEGVEGDAVQRCLQHPSR